MTTEYCGIIEITRPHKTSFMCIYRVRDNITEAKKALLEFVSQDNERREAVEIGARSKLVDVVKPGLASDDEIINRYKESLHD